MKNCILTILCEGPTEDNFAKKVLAPYLHPYGIHTKTVILQTSRKKGARGGMISFQQAVNDLGRIFASIKTNRSETNIVTTMFDFYALPNDFVGYADAMVMNGPREQVRALEEAFGRAVNRRNFIPYIQLHEFEALLFSDISKLEIDYPSCTKDVAKLKAETDRIGDPELINNGADTAPSKRIKSCLYPKYNYDKVRSGVNVAKAISLGVILHSCVHFNDWIEGIISLSNLLEVEK
ncbi:MAG: DUF4276 family protein [Muribaculaceae bacterium]|nr:DUF4276 family protein [Muribaculaceae bacterium]